MQDSNALRADVHAEPLLVRLSTASSVLGVGTTKIYELINNGKLESVMIGRGRRIKFASLKRVAETGAP